MRYSVARIRRNEVTPTGFYRNQPVARRDQIRLNDVIDQRRALGAVAGDFVVVRRWRAQRVHRAYGNCIRTISGRLNGRITLVSVSVVASLVAGCDDNHDTRIPGLLDGLAERVQFITFIDGPSQRQINNADIVLALQLNRTLDTRNHGAVCRRSIVVQNPKTNDIDVGSNAPDGVIVSATGRIFPVAADQARDHGAVTIVVIGIVHVRDQALLINDPILSGRTLEVRRVAGNPAVNDGNADTGTVPRQLRRGGTYAQNSHPAIVRGTWKYRSSGVQCVVQTDVYYIRVTFDFAKLTHRKGVVCGVNDIQAVLELRASCGHSAMVSLRWLIAELNDHVN